MFLSAWKNSVNSAIGGVGRTTDPKITKYHRENTTEDDGSYV